MRKFVSVAVLAAVAVFGTAACESSSSPATTTTTAPSTAGPVYVPPAPTTTTTDGSAALAATCVEAMGHVSDGLDAIQQGVPLLPYVGAAKAHEFLTTAHEFVQTSIRTVDLCASLSPAKAAEARAALVNLDSLIQQASLVY